MQKSLFGKCLSRLWIIIQTHIRNTDSYSDTDLENPHISLSNQWFSLIVIKVLQRVANDQIIDGKTSLKKSVILSIIRAFLRHNDKLSKTSKISEPIISESREQCQRNSGTSIYTLLALSRNIFLEIRHFLDDSGRSSDITSNSVKLLK